jgi:hypothetical protein
MGLRYGETTPPRSAQWRSVNRPRGLASFSEADSSWCEHRSRFRNHPRPSTCVLGRGARPRSRIFLCASGANEARCPRPRLPHVRDRRARALLRGVPRKGSDHRVAAQTEAPSRAPDGARSCRAAPIGCAWWDELERGGRFPSHYGCSRRGGSTPVDESRCRDDPRHSPARPSRRGHDSQLKSARPHWPSA